MFISFCSVLIFFSFFSLKVECFVNPLFNYKVGYDETYSAWKTTIGSCQRTSCGGCVSTGFTNYDGNEVLLLLKFFSNGTLDWAKKGRNGTVGYSVQQTVDEGYILCGTFNNSGILMKLFPDGSLEWVREFRDSKANHVEASDPHNYVHQTSDGGYVLTGNLAGGGTFLLKFSDTGTVEWAKNFNSTTSELFSIQETNDLGFISVGYTEIYNDDEGDILLIKFSSLGDVEWARTTNYSLSDEQGYSVQQTLDGGFIITGYTKVQNSSIFLYKFYANGSLEWSMITSSGVVGIGYSVQETSEDQFVVAGYTESFDGLREAFLFKINAAASTENKLEWAKTVRRLPGDTYYNESGKYIHQTQDGGYFLLVEMDYISTEKQERKMRMIKLDEKGESWPAECTGASDGWVKDMTVTIDDEEYVPNFITATDRFLASNWSPVVWEEEEGNSLTDLENPDLLVTEHLLCTYECNGVDGNDTDIACSGHGECMYTLNTCDCDEYFDGPKCNISTRNVSYNCFGVWTNDTEEEEVCSGKGECVDTDTCICSTDYYSLNCNVTTCYGYFSNETDQVCSGDVGAYYSCWPHDTCNCQTPDYLGQTCNITWCDGVMSNDTDSVCSNHGFCWTLDQCNCIPSYFGQICNITTCNGVYSNESGSCSDHGSCSVYNQCQCDENYFGDECQVNECQGILSNTTDDTEICNGHGTCVSFDQCQCTGNWTGSDCTGFSCIPEGFCKNGGICDGPNHCDCGDTGYTGVNCSTFSCVPGFCQNGGTCDGPSHCSCIDDWFGDDCTDYTCDAGFCKNGGVCNAPDSCDCTNTGGYTGDDCTDFTCSQTCQNGGSCDAPDHCDCIGGYFGSYCTSFSCDEGYCKNEATCDAPDHCECIGGYTGSDCSSFSCDPDFCQHSSTCIAPNFCECQTGYSGEDCSVSTGHVAENSGLTDGQIVAVVLASVVTFMIVLIILGMCCCFITLMITFPCAVVLVCVFVGLWTKYKDHTQKARQINVEELTEPLKDLALDEEESADKLSIGLGENDEDFSSMKEDLLETNLLEDGED